MQKTIVPVLLFFIMKVGTCFSQELSYTHYDNKNGLAGSTIYCMALDKDGFIWFGTDNGLSRFDGTNFKTFTTNDGLPDNEILELFTDSKGRIWMTPFKNSVCYYYHGKIYNQQNDSVLSKIEPSVIIPHYAEDSRGSILINDYRGIKLYLVKQDGTVRTIDHINNVPVTKSITASVNERGNFWVCEKNMIYEMSGEKFYPVAMLDTVIRYRDLTVLSRNFAVFAYSPDLEIYEIQTGKKKLIPYAETFIKISMINDSLLSIGKVSGVDIYNLNDFSHHTYLEGKPVTCSLTDQEGSLWFATKNKGVYRLNSRYVKNMFFPGLNADRLGVSSIFKQNKQIVLGTEMAYVFWLSCENGTNKILKKYNLFHNEVNSKIVACKVLSNGNLLFFLDTRVLKILPGHVYKELSELGAIKSIESIGNGNLLVATSYGVSILDPYTFKITDTIWKQRATAVHFKNDTFYIGALDGLYILLKDKSFKFLGADIPVLKNRISGIIESNDGTLWIATYSNGVIAYRNNRIVAHLTKDNGLSSNICRNVFMDTAFLWVCTDKGLNKVSLSPGHHTVTKYSTADGLASDIINTVFVDGTNVYVGTPEGFTFFNEDSISPYSRCDLKITEISVNGKQVNTDAVNFSIPHEQNNMTVSFVGISYRSTGDITYRYKLDGLDSVWKTTRETFLSYPTLPSNNYDLRLQAINKFGLQSKIVSIPFTVEKQFWERTWVRIFSLSFATAFVWLIIFYRIRYIKQIQQEKQQVSRKITELEQMALRSQMNPHFIFNSLNSIQQYVMDKDIAGANRFISDFSKLIRQTLHFSSKSYITLSEELDYLATYLELEKNRLEDMFTYKFSVDSGLKRNDYLLPPMILQPYIENSIRHGIRYREDNNGIILISVNLQNNYLVFTMEDNGIGRQASAQLKGKTHIEYQSKGMSLTGNRIAVLNENAVAKIDICVEDPEDENGQGTGTKVTVRFPV